MVQKPETPQGVLGALWLQLWLVRGAGASVPKCGFAGLWQEGGSSALYNQPADTSQSREFSPRALTHSLLLKP